MVQAIERFIKQAIVDKDPNVSSSAMVSSIHLFSCGNKEIVKRWVNEVQEAVNRPGSMVQYHALGLMYLIKQHDKMAVTKTVQSLTKGSGLRSPYAYCMLIRYTVKVLEDEGGLEG
jgi:coatomer protein complex subunit gamma